MTQWHVIHIVGSQCDIPYGSKNVHSIPVGYGFIEWLESVNNCSMEGRLYSVKYNVNRCNCVSIKARSSLLTGRIAVNASVISNRTGNVLCLGMCQPLHNCWDLTIFFGRQWIIFRWCSVRDAGQYYV